MVSFEWFDFENFPSSIITELFVRADTVLKTETEKEHDPWPAFLSR